MCVALAVPPQLWVDITSRINGFDGKIALIKRGAELYVRMPPDALGLLSDILGAMEEHKRYRDGVIHAWMTESNADVADTAQRRGVVDEIVISQKALDALYERLQWLEEEAGDVLLILNFYLATARGRPDIAQLSQVGIPRAQEHQKRRRSAPPLPSFPEEPPIQPMMEAPKAPPE
jgi:hypothetical protein